MSEPATPPTPDGVPLLGNGLAFSRDPVGAMERWAEHGDVVRIEVPGRSMYVVTGPQLIERVLVERSDGFALSPAQMEAFEGVEDAAVTANAGDRWARLRRALRPAFTLDAVERYADRVPARTATLVDEWDEGEHLDLFEAMRLLTVNLLADAFFGIDARGDEAVIAGAADALVARSDFRRPGQLLPDWVPTPTERRFERAVRDLDEYVDRIVSERRGDGGGDDVCSVLLAARERGELSLDEVRDNLVALLLAGHESPSLALTHAWRLLSDRPDVRESLVAEYDAVVGDGLPDAAAFDDLERTRNVVAETLRLYPPTTGVARRATEPVSLGEFEIPRGAELLLPQWVPHRDERWWDDPESFRPSRWREDRDRPDYAYFPFSGGPRNCIGAQFARRELVLALATMVGRVELDVKMEGPLTFTPSIGLRPETEMTATVWRR